MYIEVTESHKFPWLIFSGMLTLWSYAKPIDIKWQNHNFSCFFPSFKCLLKGTLWHFKSLLFCLSRHLPNWVFCPSGTLQMCVCLFFFVVICIEIGVRQEAQACFSLVMPYLFMWHDMCFSLQQVSLNVKIYFISQGILQDVALIRNMHTSYYKGVVGLCTGTNYILLFGRCQLHYKVMLTLAASILAYILKYSCISRLKWH